MLAIGLCALLGLLGAYLVASEPIAYIASTTYGILFFFVLIPAVAILLIGAMAAAILQKSSYAAALFMSCVMLPVFFIGGHQAMRAVGWAQYETSGFNEMRPIDEEPNGNVIVIYTRESTFEEQEKLSNEVIHPWKEGLGFTGETGVRASIGLGEIHGRTAQKILFKASATEDKKDKLRMGLQASPVVYRYFENLNEWEVRQRLQTKPGEKIL